MYYLSYLMMNETMIVSRIEIEIGTGIMFTVGLRVEIEIETETETETGIDTLIELTLDTHFHLINKRIAPSTPFHPQSHLLFILRLILQFIPLRIISISSSLVRLIQASHMLILMMVTLPLQ